jgi:hypothetical protein
MPCSISFHILILPQSHRQHRKCSAISLGDQLAADVFAHSMRAYQLTRRSGLDGISASDYVPKFAHNFLGSGSKEGPFDDSEKEEDVEETPSALLPPRKIPN